MLKPCEVVIKFSVNVKKLDHIYNAIAELSKAGVSFDTGGCREGDLVNYDWEFDWSLKGAEVFFKRFKNAKDDVTHSGKSK